MSKMQKIGDLTACTAGYFSVDPTGEVLAGAHTLLSTVAPISSGAVDEILKMLAGLALGILSKFVYGMIDKYAAKKKAGKQDEQAPQPETLNIQNINDGNEKKEY